MSFLDSITAAAKDEANKAALDQVEKNKLRVEVGSDGAVEGSISATRRGWTFTAYVSGLLTGAKKSAKAGARVERSF